MDADKLDAEIHALGVQANTLTASYRDALTELEAAREKVNGLRAEIDANKVKHLELLREAARR